MGNGANNPWLLGGDFNAILGYDERKGGSSRPAHGCGLFQTFVDNNGLIDLGFVGPKFTWRREGLFERLDRLIGNQSWMDFFPSAQVHHLAQIQSDHKLILLKLPGFTQVHSRPKPFIFLAPWLMHQSFNDLVKDHWNAQQPICSTQNVQIWNCEVFRHIIKKKRRLQARIKGIQKTLEERYVEKLVSLETELRKDYKEICLQEELLWFQKSREDWINFGDRNTAYYHAKTIARRRRNRIGALKDDEGKWCDHPVELQILALNFFKNLYTKETVELDSRMNSGMFPPITDVEINMLKAHVTM